MSEVDDETEAAVPAVIAELEAQTEAIKAVAETLMIMSPVPLQRPRLEI